MPSGAPDPRGWLGDGAQRRAQRLEPSSSQAERPRQMASGSLGSSAVHDVLLGSSVTCREQSALSPRILLDPRNPLELT